MVKFRRKGNYANRSAAVSLQNLKMKEKKLISETLTAPSTGSASLAVSPFS